MGTAGAPREFGANLLVEDRQSDRVLLPKRQIANAGREGCCVIEFVESRAAVGHAFGSIEQDGAPKVGVFFVLFDHQFVLSAKDLPVDVAQIISRGVLAVLHELDRLAKVRASVHS